MIIDACQLTNDRAATPVKRPLLDRARSNDTKLFDESDLRKNQRPQSGPDCNI
jgi:hypothetical protein